MKLFQRITLALMGCMLLSTPAMAADYSFETKAPADYYGSTAYEEVYGAQYNYGGQNAVDFLDLWLTAHLLRWQGTPLSMALAVLPEASIQTGLPMITRFSGEDRLLPR